MINKITEICGVTGFHKSILDVLLNLAEQHLYFVHNIRVLIRVFADIKSVKVLRLDPFNKKKYKGKQSHLYMFHAHILCYLTKLLCSHFKHLGF